MSRWFWLLLVLFFIYSAFGCASAPRPVPVVPATVTATTVAQFKPRLPDKKELSRTLQAIGVLMTVLAREDVNQSPEDRRQTQYVRLAAVLAAGAYVYAHLNEEEQARVDDLVMSTAVKQKPKVGL